jgi:hypothetical protein
MLPRGTIWNLHAVERMVASAKGNTYSLLIHRGDHAGYSKDDQKNVEKIVLEL